MATDGLSPPGSSSYSSNTMYVGDGTWDSTRNSFLLPNLVGLNFETMRYNGMGNRFASMPGYHGLIRAHGIIAVMAFLVLLPAAILMAQFYSRNPFWALRMHIYLQILVVGLSTVVFITGFNAVGLNRSLTNPHHGIGVAIYTLILVQAIGGWWIHKREKKRIPVKLPVKLVLHQWLGRTIALLGFAQVPLGLTLYGSPKWMFILYAVWMFFLLVLFFVLCYRAIPPLDGYVGGRERSRSHGGTVMSDRKPSRFGGLLGPLALGAGAAALLGGKSRDRSRSRSHSRSRRTEVISSRRGSGSYVEQEKYDERTKKSGGIMDKALKAGALFGAAGLAKSFFSKKKGRRDDDDYSSVAHDTPSKRPARRHSYSDSELTESVVVSRMEEGRRPGGGILPGPGDPVLAAAAISAAAPRPTTPRPVRRQSSHGSGSYSYESTLSPSRRHQSTHKARNGILAGLGLGWFAKKMKDRRDKKEEERLDRIDRERMEEEKLAHHGNTPSRLIGDGTPYSGRRPQRRPSIAESSELSSIITDPHIVRPGAIPPSNVPPPFQPGPIATDMEARRSRYDVVTEPVSMPPIPHDPQGILHVEDSGSEAYVSAGGRPHRRHSDRRRREGEIAAAAAVAEAASHAAREEARRRRSRSRTGQTDIVSPPVSVKVKVHGDKDRNVTLRRLTEQEAAAEREARRSDRRRRRADSLSSLSGTDTATSRRRYRREEGSRRGHSPPPAMAPLNPPAPPFAAGRKPKDSAYYSGQPGASSPAAALPAGSIGSPESHGTWSAMSPSVDGGDGAEAAAERRRRRRLERNQRGQTATATVDFT
ncbi:hypothetical protein WAI453_000861 [Rhynchosporium graminicola]|uniref:Cytochrome b561 domain-containing protein n=1 Tax=Rhynchosporium graminicola TaxID=2792576 RepID=A0A1E1K4X7_9HELO|nr:uncharacterized protein RCO7_07825 [Rhynchosporium commune]